MTITLTQGTNTYITLEDARTYVSDFALDGFPTDDEEAKALLVRAARSLDRKYGNAFIGYKRQSTQTLLWPRTVVSQKSAHSVDDYNLTVDSDGNLRDFSGYPAELGQAQVELAIMIGEGFDPLQQVEAAITSFSDRVDVIGSAKTYKSSYQADPWYSIKLILRPLLKVSTGINYTRGA